MILINNASPQIYHACKSTIALFSDNGVLPKYKWDIL